jgi:hypothetical protein
MTASVAAAGTVTRLGASTEGAWLRSRTWDLWFLILSAALVPIPLLLYHGLGVSQTAVNLIVAGLVGGPHLYSTFTYTFLEPNYRRRHLRFLLGSLALPVIVTVLAFVNLQILLTIFFTWASIHVLHQITYINDCYSAKRPVRRSRKGRIIDYGVVFTCLYPMATPQILNHDFQLGGEQLYVPGWADHGVVADLQVFAAFALFGIFFVLWMGKNIREARQGLLTAPSVLLIGLTIVVGFTLPLFPNIDVAFQGFNTWHSLQYLALTWFILSRKAENGEIGSQFVRKISGTSHTSIFYASMIGATLLSGVIYLILWRGFNLPQDRAYYVVVLSFLLIHYFYDHILFRDFGTLEQAHARS